MPNNNPALSIVSIQVSVFSVLIRLDEQLIFPFYLFPGLDSIMLTKTMTTTSIISNVCVVLFGTLAVIQCHIAIVGAIQ